MTTLFSVVVPCYGHEQFLAAAIESLWAQSHRDFEIVAIDDGSPDNSGAQLRSMAEKSPQPMRVVSTPNRGAFAALNAGTELATGAYLAFLNDDDLYHRDRLEVFSRAIDRCDSFLWGFSAVEPIDEHGQVIDPSLIPDMTRRRAVQISRVPLDAFRTLSRWNTTVSSGNLVVETEHFRRSGGFRDLRFTHDWDLALRLLAEAPPFVAERPLYSYRVHLGNAFAAQAKGPGARLADAESVQVLQEHRAREDSRVTFTPLVKPIADIDPDEAWAIKFTLWTMSKLRSVPFLYSAARSSFKRLRRLRTR